MRRDPSGQPFKHKSQVKKIKMYRLPSKASSCRFHGMVGYWFLEKSLGIPSGRFSNAIKT